MKRPLRSFFAGFRRQPLAVWYHEAYRFPLAGTETSTGIETRRAKDALHFLLHSGAVTQSAVREPLPATYEALGRVHVPEYLESLSAPATLAHIFAIDEADAVVDELLKSVRLATGATIEAAFDSLRTGTPALNLVGGFHHAFPSKGAGFCAVNDVAVAIAQLRADGHRGPIAVLDLDAHPPDGTAACLQRDVAVWQGSLSGVSWGPLPGVDETVLPEGTSDAAYLEALDGLLGRMPKVDLTFVLAGGDVVVGDRLGLLGLSVRGVRERDLRVAAHLRDTPQVWLSAGGYGAHAWKVLAGTGLALALKSDAPIPLDYEPLDAELKIIHRGLPREVLGDGPLLTEADLPELYGRPAHREQRLLGFYTKEGIELALERYGILPLLRRLGFRQLAIELDTVGAADRFRLLCVDEVSPTPAVLVEAVLEKKSLGGGTFLFVNWLSLRNPRATFSPKRPQLPGQEVPGLGLAKEATAMLGLIAERLLLDGVAYRPSWYHTAWAARHTARFVSPQVQGRFEALQRDLRELPLLEATRAIADGRVRLNGQPYTWEPDDMVRWRHPPAASDAAEVARVRDSSHFTLA